MRLFGSLEAGGSRMVCAITGTDGEILERREVPTTSPAETMPKLIDFFDGKGLAALGIGCFGPACVDKYSPAYGTILSTPKLAWQGYPMRRVFQDALNIPVGFDTAANAAALGEASWGCTQKARISMYLSVGMGIGMGVMIDGKPHHGILHPEGGHIPVHRHPDDPLSRGICPYHTCCLEGLASGPAIEARWGGRGETLSGRREVWRMEAYYLGQAIAAYVMTLSPERIVVGGGVMGQRGLLELVRAAVRRQINGCFHAPALDDLTKYIVPPSLNGQEGILGGLQLALDAFFTYGGKL